MIFPVAAAPKGTAVISADGVYRYRLTRRTRCVLRWMQPLVIIGTNPSTATADVDDPTILKEVKFAEAWQCTELIKVNAFALRSTDPKALKAHPDPVGPENDTHILQAAQDSRPRGIILCAWGNPGMWFGRGPRVFELLRLHGFRLYHLGLNKNGSPKHPLYLLDSTQLQEYAV